MMTSGQAECPQNLMPAEVLAEQKEGHCTAWRRDHIPLSTASVHRVQCREALLIFVELIQLDRACALRERKHHHRKGQCGA